MGRSARILLIAVLAGVSFVYPLLAPTPHRIDQAHFDLVEQGMTVAQVETIFGVPAGSYDWAERHPYFVLMLDEFSFDIGHPAPEAPEARRARLIREPVLWQTWISRHGAFTVAFDSQGRTVRKHRNDTRIVPPWHRWWKAVWKR